MADFTDRIKLVFEAVTSDATQGIGKLSGKTTEAQSGFDKLKGAAGSAFDKIASSPALIAGAGVAIAKVAFDLASGFGEAALSANKFAIASGLAVEDASRWQEVAGDVGVSTETLEGAVNKLNIAGSKGVLTELGIGGADTNEKLLNALTHLNGIDNAEQRASEGAKIFGKSWASLAPLVDSSANLRDNLAAVSDQIVIDESEVAKAEHFRDAMDTLGDKLTSLKNAVGGELIEPIANLAEALGNVESSIEGITDAIPGMDGGLLAIATGPLRNVTDGLNTLTDSSGSLTDRARGLGQAITGAIPGPLGSWAGGLFDVADKSDDAAEAADAAAAAAQRQADAAKAIAEESAAAEEALVKLTSATLAGFNANLALADAADRTDDAIGKYTLAAGAAEAASWGNSEANDAARQAMNDAEQAALGQAAAADALGKKNAEVNGTQWGAAESANAQANALRAIAGTLDPSSPLRQQLLNYASDLEAIPKSKSTTINAETEDATRKVKGLMGLITDFVLRPFTVKVQASTPSAVGSSASSAPSSLALVPAAAVLGAPVVSPRAAPSTSSPVINLSVQVAPFTQPAEVGRAIADYLDAFYRRSGTRARAVA